VRGNTLGNVRVGRKVIHIIARTAACEFQAKVEFAESKLGTPWAGFYKCQDFASEVAAGRPHSFQRDALVAVSLLVSGWFRVIRESATAAKETARAALESSAPSVGAKRNVKHAPCAAAFLAFIDGLLLRFSLVCRCTPTCEIPIRGERRALFVESGPQDARLAALRTDGHGFFFRTRLIVFALRPSSPHILAAICDRAPRDAFRKPWSTGRSGAGIRGRTDGRFDVALLAAKFSAFHDGSLLRAHLSSGRSPGNEIAVRRDGAADAAEAGRDNASGSARFGAILHGDLLCAGLGILLKRPARDFILLAVRNGAPAAAALALALDSAEFRLNIAAMRIANGPAAPAAGALHALGHAIRTGRGRNEGRPDQRAYEK